MSGKWLRSGWRWQTMCHPIPSPANMWNINKLRKYIIPSNRNYLHRVTRAYSRFNLGKDNNIKLQHPVTLRKSHFAFHFLAVRVQRRWIFSRHFLHIVTTVRVTAWLVIVRCASLLFSCSCLVLVFVGCLAVLFGCPWTTVMHVFAYL
jgi:hypothetical protein